MYVLLLSAGNLVSSLVKVCVRPVTGLGQLFLELLIEETAEYVA
jgi:hypothetical protein